MSGTTQRKTLTALEWLRVTHADTLSGRRIEEAVAAARADERQRWTTAVETLAEELQGTAEVTGGKVNGFVFADRLRGLTTSSEEGTE